MDFIKKLLNPRSLPFFSKDANIRYNDILEYRVPDQIGEHKVQKIIQEMRQRNKFFVSQIDAGLNYTEINTKGEVRQLNIGKSKFSKAAKELFNYCDTNFADLEQYEKAKGEVLDKETIRLTYLTADGAFSICGNITELPKQIIPSKSIVLFGNLLTLTRPGHLKKVIERTGSNNTST